MPGGIAREEPPPLAPKPTGCCGVCNEAFAPLPGCVCVGDGGNSHGVSCLIGVVPHLLFENNSSGMDVSALVRFVFAFVLKFVNMLEPMADD